MQKNKTNESYGTIKFSLPYSDDDNGHGKLGTLQREETNPKQNK